MKKFFFSLLTLILPMAAFSQEEQEGGSEAAKEAVTADMAMAMMNYMPLRGAFSFGGGITAEEAEQLLKKLNGQL